MPRFNELLETFFYRPDEDVGALFSPDLETNPPLGEVAAVVDEEAPGELVVFRLEGGVYALPVDRLRKIVKVSALTEVPRGGPELLGVVNLRGEVLPVYSLKRRLGFAAEPARIAGPEADLASVPRSARILVVRAPDGDAGLLVDAVLEVVRRRNPLCILLDLEQVLP